MLKLLGKKLFYNFFKAMICTSVLAYLSHVFYHPFCNNYERQIGVSIPALIGETISPKEKEFSYFLPKHMLWLTCGYSKELSV